MKKFELKKEIVPIIFLVLTIIASIATYKYLPDRVVSHWNFQGVADGWSSKNFHAIFFPCLILFMYLLFYFLPTIDPKRERYQEFEKVYYIFESMMIGVLFIVFLVATLFNLGYDIPIGNVISLVIGIMMIVIGNYMGKIKNNWFVGIKTPWTLSSENVWNKTHRFGGRAFIVFGLIIITAPYLNVVLATVIFLLGTFLVVFGTMIYSYLLYRKENKK